jgi:hypothetical protein
LYIWRDFGDRVAPVTDHVHELTIRNFETTGYIEEIEPETSLRRLVADALVGLGARFDETAVKEQAESLNREVAA